MISLDQALDRLLHDRSYRSAFLAERFDALDLAPDDLDALGSIDRQQLVRTAERVAKDLIGRKHRGSGGLLELYPNTLGADRLDETVYRFLESAAFQDYRELPFAGDGISLEEAFFRFCEAEGIGEPAVREQEFFLP